MTEEDLGGGLSEVGLGGYLEIAKKMTCLLSEVNQFLGELSFYLVEFVVAPAVQDASAFLEATEQDLAVVRSKMTEFSQRLSRGLFLEPQQQSILTPLYKLLKLMENFSVHCFDFERLEFFHDDLEDDLKTFECGVLDMHLDFRTFRLEFVGAFQREEHVFQFTEN